MKSLLYAPAPWKFRETPTGYFVVAAQDRPLARVGKCVNDDLLEIRRKSTVLMAAAPELLEALEECIEHLEHSTPQGKEAFNKAKAAIKKARGERR